MEMLRSAARGWIALLLLPGCAQTARSAAVAAAATQPDIAPEWQRKIRTQDEERVRRAEEAWSAALAEARARGFGQALLGEGGLLSPGAALERPEPPPGPYRCRVVKLGTAGANRRPFRGYKPSFCYVEAFGSQLAITKQTGSERPAGYLYPDEGGRRMIFLGTVTQGDEKPLAYGEDEARDMVGIVERIGPFRYRLVTPWPRSDSKLDIMELVPAVG